MIVPDYARLASATFLVALLMIAGAASASASGRPDIKVHTVGRVKRVVSNGPLSAGTYSGVVCEYPPDAGMENGQAGYPVLEIAAVARDHGTVTHLYTQWWDPGSLPDDSIWVIRNFDSAHIPFWGEYAGLADEDFVYRCRSDQPHTVTVRCGTGSPSVPVSLPPLHVQLLVSNVTWSIPPLDDIILTRYRIVSEQYHLSDLYVSTYFIGGIGPSNQPSNSVDDRTSYDTQTHLAVVTDGGMFDGVQSSNCVGFRLFPPVGTIPGSLKWTSKDDFSRAWALQCASTPEAYARVMHDLLSSGVQLQGHVPGANWIAMGPFTLNPGDTLEVWSAEILGTGVDDIVRKSALLDSLYPRKFGTLRPPPQPPLRIERSSKTLTLHWESGAGDPDPEHWRDDRRSDGIDLPFEGYRVYRSTKSRDGPWTMVYECDIAGDGFANDIGLTHTYVDDGLVNHAEYSYAVTSFSKPDTVARLPSRESSMQASRQSAIPGDAPRERVGAVAAVPNPYRSDIAYNSYDPPWERPSARWPHWTESDRRIRFINLPGECVLSIFTLAGDLVYLIRHSDPSLSFRDWNLTSYVGQAVSSGLYLFSVEDQRTGEVQVGKFVIIR